MPARAAARRLAAGSQLQVAWAWPEGHPDRLAGMGLQVEAGAPPDTAVVLVRVDTSHCRLQLLAAPAGGVEVLGAALAV